MALIMNDVFEKKTIVNLGVIKKTRHLIGKFKKSVIATKMLMEQTKTIHGKPLILLLPSPTRWGSNFLMLKRLLIIIREVNQVKKNK